MAAGRIARAGRTLMQMSVGDQPQAAILRSTELLGTVVAPKVRAGTGDRGVLAPPLVRDGARVPEQVG